MLITLKTETPTKVLPQFGWLDVKRRTGLYKVLPLKSDASHFFSNGTEVFLLANGYLATAKEDVWTNHQFIEVEDKVILTISNE